MKVRYEPRFERALRRKTRRSPKDAERTIETVELILNEPENRGLNQHLLNRRERIWEAYISDSARLTYHREGETVVFRNNCRHDIIDRRQW
jgi:mRNA-degrading endonuclease YafQ of YafQ-DinJ toxin-antitoxin module